MLCRCAASVGGDQMLMFTRDAIMQDIHIVGAWLNRCHTTASNMCSRGIDSVVLRSGQWLGSSSLKELSVQSNIISCQGIALSRSQFRWERFRCKSLSNLIPIKLSLWKMASI